MVRRAAYRHGVVVTARDLEAARAALKEAKRRVADEERRAVQINIKDKVQILPNKKMTILLFFGLFWVSF